MLSSVGLGSLIARLAEACMQLKDAAGLQEVGLWGGGGQGD